MKIKFQRILFLSAALGQVAWASEKTFECGASGKSLARYGEGLTKAQANFTFIETVNPAVEAVSKDGTPRNKVLKDVKGKVEIFENGDDEVIYSGTFDISAQPESPKYEPKKYKKASQFKMDATEERADMWGSLVLEDHSKNKPFKAHYIFQAGDHMGGTLNMNCKEIVPSEHSAEDAGHQ